MKPYLSIIVPVFKAELYLRQCLDSILAQTFNDFELILVDDGSPDSCPRICDQYKEKDMRVKVIHKSNGGLVSARKEGLRASCGEYIGYVDSDDWIENNMYELLCEGAKIYKSEIVICDFMYSYSDKDIKGRQMIQAGFYDKDKLKNIVYPFMLYSGTFYKFGLYPAVWNKIFKKELLEKNQYSVHNDIRIGEDAACSYPCLLDASSVYILESKYLYHYRQNELSMTKSYDENYVKSIILLYKLLADKNRDKEGNDLSIQLDYYLIYLVLEAVNNEININNKKSSKEKRNYIKKICLYNDINRALRSISLKGIPMRLKAYIWLMQKNLILILTLVKLLAHDLERIRYVKNS